MLFSIFNCQSSLLLKKYKKCLVIIMLGSYCAHRWWQIFVLSINRFHFTWCHDCCVSLEVSDIGSSPKTFITRCMLIVNIFVIFFFQFKLNVQYNEFLTLRFQQLIFLVILQWLKFIMFTSNLKAVVQVR